VQEVPAFLHHDFPAADHPFRQIDLMPTDRYTFIDGIYTYWIYPTDKPHAVGNTTAPRIETHYTNFRTGTKMWTGDILVDSPSNNVTIFQVHTGASGGGPVYLQVHGGNLDLQAMVAGCGPAQSLLDYDPVAGTATVLLGPPLNGGSVIEALPYPGQR